MMCSASQAFDTDVANCGACLDACSTNHGVPSCSAGACSIACETGFRDCKNGARDDGCETDIDVDPEHCGACDMPCPSALNADATCASGGVCGLACKTFFEDCETSSPDCETSVGSDPDNCGACGRNCLGGPCASGQCQAFDITTNVFRPGALAVDDTYVYFVRRKPAAPFDLMRVKKDGSEIPEFLATTNGSPPHLAVDATHLYYREGDTIRRIGNAPPAGAPETMASLVSSDFALDADSLYYCSGPGMGPGVLHATAKSTPGSSVDLSPTAGTCTALVVDATHLYWLEDISPEESAVKGVNKATGTLADFGSTCLTNRLAQDTTHLFVGVNCSIAGRIIHIDKATGLTNMLLSDPEDDGFTVLLVDDEHIYVSTYYSAQENRVIRYDSDGTGKVVLFAGPIQSTEVDFFGDDGAALYFSDNKGQTLRKLAK